MPSTIESGEYCSIFTFSPRVSRQACTGEGPEECRTVYETSCSTKYREAGEREGKFLADTSCEKLPVKICGAGCNYVDGDEECHDKVITTIVNVPEVWLGCIFSNLFYYSEAGSLTMKSETFFRALNIQPCNL